MPTRAPSGVFLAILAGFVLSGALLWTDGAGWAVFLFVVTGWVVSLCLHEFAHALVAYLGGDHSVADKGYLTLDPRHYAEPGLSLVLPVLFVLMGGIGLPGGAVWIDRSALRGRWVASLVSAAGPATNVVFAAACLVPISLGAFDGSARTSFVAGLAFLGFLQVTAAMLNLLPVPGLDGFGIVEPHLSPGFRAKLAPIRRWGLLAVIALLFLPAPNRVFFNGVYSIIEWFGVPGYLSAVGGQLFRFWEGGLG